MPSHRAPAPRTTASLLVGLGLLALLVAGFGSALTSAATSAATPGEPAVEDGRLTDPVRCAHRRRRPTRARCRHRRPVHPTIADAGPTDQPTAAAPARGPLRRSRPPRRGPPAPPSSS